MASCVWQTVVAGEDDLGECLPASNGDSYAVVTGHWRSQLLVRYSRDKRLEKSRKGDGILTHIK